MTTKIEYCNWSFDECLVNSNKWLVKRDCEDEPIILTRGSSKNWSSYQKSLEPRYQGQPQNAFCPKCFREINGVNPYDDGETWRKSWQKKIHS